MPIAYVVTFAVCFFASAIGAICGIGGGVIIKPVLDATGLFPVESVNFLSGCTVLSMAIYSVLRSRADEPSPTGRMESTALAVGAVAGGVAGKGLFSFIETLFSNPNTAGSCQAVALAVITSGTLAYTLNKGRIFTHHVTGIAPSIAIGCVLGLLSSFLGIGGGPINLIVLFYFYSMTTKGAARNSLYIIMFSQGASTVLNLFTVDIASIGFGIVAGMICCGIAGGIAGRAVNKRVESEHVDKLFIGLMAVIILICIYNAIRLGGVA